MPRPIVIDQIAEQFHVHTAAQLRHSHGEEYFECVAILPYDDSEPEDVEGVIEKLHGIKATLSKFGVFIVTTTTIRLHHAVKWVMSARSACKEVEV